MIRSNFAEIGQTSTDFWFGKTRRKKQFCKTSFCVIVFSVCSKMDKCVSLFKFSCATIKDFAYFSRAWFSNWKFCIADNFRYKINLYISKRSTVSRQTWKYMSFLQSPGLLQWNFFIYKQKIEAKLTKNNSNKKFW